MQLRMPSPGYSWDALLRLSLIFFAAAMAACSTEDDLFSKVVFNNPDTSIGYDVKLIGSPSDDVTELAELSLATYRFKDKGAASLAFLRRRSEGDLPTLLKILRSRGYYASSAEIKIEETELGTALVTIAVDPGQPYMLTRHEFSIEQTGKVAPPELDSAKLGSPVGRQALSAEIAAAEGAGVATLRRIGFPYADFKGRKGLANPSDATLEIDSEIVAGPAFTFGVVTFEGLKTVEEAYLLSYLPWETGQSLDEFQRSLFATELFAAAVVHPPEEPPSGMTEPAPLRVTVELEEGPRRRIEGGLRYDTDLGPTARASFEHRNLFGANERLLIEATGGRLEQSFGIGLRKPQFLRAGQDLLADLTFLRTVDDAFDALSVTSFAGLERQVTKRWRGGLGILDEVSKIDDNGDESTAFLLGVPFYAAYDRSNDILNPTKGVRLRFEATPFIGVHENVDTEFLTLDASGSIYKPVDKDRRYVVAARGRVASILVQDIDSVPATRRLYSGGSGSVRGYAQDFIGPLDANNDPVGGLSAVEAGVELRARLYGDLGGVVFAEAGSVSTEIFPDFGEGVQAATGLGLRYYSPAGPIRVDFAVPLSGRSADDEFQVYFSIGQAF
jgi:translocation and assembly module TamA